MTEVSVIIPAWNAGSTIARALRSVLLQDTPPAEIIVIDDGSDDDTAGAAATIAAADTRGLVQVLHQPRGGAGRARNAGLRAAKGEFAAFLDADDEWLPEKLRYSLDHLKRSDDILVSHNYMMVTESGEQLIDCERHFRARPDPYVTLFQRNYIATSTVVARRQAILDVGAFDVSLPSAQDLDLWLRLLARADAPFHVLSQPLTRYHVNPRGISSDVRRRRECSLAVMVKNSPALRQKTNRPLVPLFTRTLVIYYEAFTGCIARGQWFAAARQLVAAVPQASFTLIAAWRNR